MLKNKFLKSKEQKPIIKDEKPSKKNKILKKVLFIVLFIITLISVLRIPYSGQVIDSVAFSFLFGYAKYILYAYLLFFCTLKIFNIKKKPLYSKRIFFFILFSTIFTSMLIGGIQIVINYEIQNEFSYYVNDIWMAKVWNLDNLWYFGDSKYFDGGLVGATLSSISGVFIICLAILLIIIFFFIFFPNQRKKVIKKLLAKTSAFKENHVMFDQSQSLKAQPLISSQKQDNFDIKDTYKKFDINLIDIKKEIETFLEDNKISFKKFDTSENDNLINVEFSIGVDTLEDFELFKEKLNNKFHHYKYELSRIDNVIQIKFYKFVSKLNNTLTKYLSTKVENDFDFCFCLTENSQPLIMNLNQNNFIGISSNSELKTLDYLNALISHLSINYNKQFLQIILLSPEPIQTRMLSSQNTLKKNIDSINGIKKFIEILKEEFQVIKKEFNENDNLYEKFEKVKQIDYKYKFIIINHIEIIYKKHPDLFDEIKRLVKRAKQYGLNFVLIDYSEDVKMFTQLEFSLILSDNENPKKQKANSSPKLYIPKNKQKYQVIVPRVNKEELEVISDKLASIFIKFNE